MTVSGHACVRSGGNQRLVSARRVSSAPAVTPVADTLLSTSPTWYFRGMIVKDILEVKGSDVETVSPDATVADLAQQLRDRSIGAAVVVEDGDVVGIVTERDVVGLAAGGGALNTPVSMIMTPNVEVCAPEDRIDVLATTMTNKRFRHFPVMEDGALVGIVSIGDVVKARLDDLEAEREHLTEYLHS